MCLVLIFGFFFFFRSCDCGQTNLDCINMHRLYFCRRSDYSETNHNNGYLQRCTKRTISVFERMEGLPKRICRFYQLKRKFGMTWHVSQFTPWKEEEKTRRRRKRKRNQTSSRLIEYLRVKQCIKRKRIKKREEKQTLPPRKGFSSRDSSSRTQTDESHVLAFQYVETRVRERLYKQFSRYRSGTVSRAWDCGSGEEFSDVFRQLITA